MPSKNLKILISGDSKPFVQSVQKSDKAMSAFTKQSTGAIDQLASSFGVNTSAIKGHMNTFNSGLGALSASFKGTAGSAGILSKAFNVLKIALISSGIGAILVGIGLALAGVIKYFTGTQRGADKLAVFMKKFSAIMSVLSDRLALFGEGITLLFSGKFKAGAELMKNAFVGIGEEIKRETALAGDLEARRQALADKEIAYTTILGDRKKQIDQLRLAAEDETKSKVAQREALEKAMQLELQSLEDEKELQRERIAIMEEDVALGESMREDYIKLADEKNKLNTLESSSLKLQKRLQTEINSVTNQINAETAAVIANAKAKEEARLKEAGISNTKITNDTTSYAFGGKVEGIEIKPPSIQPHIEAAEGISNVWLDAAAVINDSFISMADGFTDAIAQMIAGEADAGQIGQVVLNTLADMAINVGKMSIGAGIAVLGIKQALMSLNPAVAIAGGVALLALGKVMKAGLAKAATGGGSVSASNVGTGVAGDTYNGARAEAQTLHIEVTGALTANVRDMAMQLSKENVRVKKV